jgi:hypothetical protein
MGKDRDTVPGIRSNLENSDEEDEDDDSDDAHSEVAASSEEEEAESKETFKQGVEEILQTTGKNLKRGKTMAMKEAISTAKKCGVEKARISEAEQRLVSHKKAQRRDEVDQEVRDFFESTESRNLQMCESLAGKAREAECSQELIQRLEERMQELILTRDLEEEELEQAREYLKQSCRDFVLAATRKEGRPVVLLDLKSGRKVKGHLSLDPPLTFLRFSSPHEEEGTNTAANPPAVSTAGGGAATAEVPPARGCAPDHDEEVPVSSLSAVGAIKD